MHATSRKKHLLLVAKLAILALVAWGLYATLAGDLEKLSENPPTIEMPWLVLSGVLYLVAEIPFAWFWYLVLSDTHQQTTPGSTLRAFYVSQTGKYAPGKALVVVLRTVFLRGAHVERTVVAATVFLETLTTLAVGGLVSVVILAVARWQGWADYPIQWRWIAGAVGMTLIVGLPTVPAICGRLLRILGVTRINPTAAQKLSAVRVRTFALGGCAIAVGWFVQGISLWATLRGLNYVGANPVELLTLHTAAVALGVLAGFLTFIPGGLGGREYVHTQLLLPVYGPVPALYSAIVLRVVWLVSEVAVSGLLYLAGSRRIGAVKESDPQANRAPAGNRL